MALPRNCASALKSSLKYTQIHASPNAASTPNVIKTNHYGLNLLHALIYTVPLAAGLRSSFPPLGYSPYIRIALITIRNNKDRTLDIPSILISISNTGNRGMNNSTGWMKLVHVANSQAVSHEGLIRSYIQKIHTSLLHRVVLKFHIPSIKS